MRALMISPALPALTGGGLSMRMGLFLRSLTRIAKTDVLVLPLGELSTGQVELDKSFNADCKIIPLAGREDTLFTLISRINDPLQRNEAFRHYGRSSLAAALSTSVLADVAKTTAGMTYDLIHVGRSYMAEVSFVVSGDAFRSLDADENDAEVSRRQARLLHTNGNETGAARQLAEADAFDQMQHRALGKFDVVFASSKLEAESLQPFGNNRPICVVPNAVTRPPSTLRKDDGQTLIFVGSLGYWPNSEGILWFVREVWPLLIAKSHQQPRLLIVGRDCPPEIKSLSSIVGIIVYPDVANLDELYAQATLAVVPLRAGGGTRIKIIEAVMHGLPVVSTRLGAEGLSFIDDREIWLADDAPSMAEVILSALANPSQAIQLGQRAQDKAHANFDFEATSHSLACNWTKLLAKRTASNTP